jgi:hypothetical protein
MIVFVGVGAAIRSCSAERGFGSLLKWVMILATGICRLYAQGAFWRATAALYEGFAACYWTAQRQAFKNGLKNPLFPPDLPKGSTFQPARHIIGTHQDRTNTP